MKTSMEKNRLFRDLQIKRKLTKNCPVKERDVEHELIMKMTEQDPQDRPSSSEIKEKWLKRWENQLDEDSD